MCLLFPSTLFGFVYKTTVSFWVFIFNFLRWMLGLLIAFLVYSFEAVNFPPKNVLLLAISHTFLDLVVAVVCLFGGFLYVFSHKHEKKNEFLCRVSNFINLSDCLPSGDSKKDCKLKIRGQSQGLCPH